MAVLVDGSLVDCDVTVLESSLLGLQECDVVLC